MRRACLTVFMLCGIYNATVLGQVLTIPDGTPVRLRLGRTVSSATAHLGDMVDFEVAEPVVVHNIVVIPKDSLASGQVSKVEPKRRFGRGGELEINVNTVRLGDGGTAPLRATREEGDALHGGRLAATVAASPVLIWVKGKNVEFERGQETTAYIRGDVRVDQALLQQRYQDAISPAPPPAPATTAVPAPGPVPAPTPARDVLTNRDITEMKKAGLSDDVILTKIQTSDTDFRTGTQDLIDLKTAGVSERVIQAMLQKSPQR